MNLITKIIITILFLTGTITLGSIIGGSVYLVKSYNDFNCDNINIGLITGIGSSIILLFNLILYCVNCVKSFIIPSLVVIGALIYNCYLYNKLSNNCIEYYKEKDLWEFYNYYIFSLCLLVLFLIVFGLHKCFN